MNFSTKRKFFRGISLLLCIMMMMQLTQLFAVAVDEIPSEVGISAEAASYPVPLEYSAEDAVEIVDEEFTGGVTEIQSLRRENVKHFKKTDGTYEAISYGGAVHRKDENGNWQDIDNRLALQAKSGNQLYATSDARTVFAKSYVPNGQLFGLNENGYSISLSLISNTISSGSGELSTYAAVTPTVAIEPTVTNHAVRQPSNAWESVEEAARIDNTSSVRYANVKPDTDIEYILTGNNVKENIIVKARAQSYQYTFRMETDGLIATLQENGAIYLSDGTTGEVKYYIPAPYMYDANEVVSTAVSYTLTQTADGVYQLKVIADAEWINASDRAFPVTIDPTIITASIDLTDTYINSSAPTVNYGSDETLWLSSTKIPFVKITPPTLPSGATMHYAMLHMAYYYHISTGNLTAGAYKVLSPWSENTLTWSSASTYANQGINSVCMGFAEMPASSAIREPTPGDAQFEVTDAVNTWYTTPSNYYGIAIKYSSGSNLSVILKSSEAGDGDEAYIRVVYTHYVPDGVYAFSSAYSPSRYMTVENDSPWENYNMQQELVSGNNPAVSFDRSSLFKISRVGTTERYIIRLMQNNNMTFGISGTEVVTKAIPSDDASVAAEDTFFLTWSNDGFVIQPYASQYVINMSSTSVANLNVVSKTAVTPKSVWYLVEYTGAHRGGSTAYRSGDMIAGNTIVLTPIVYSTRINANKPYMYIDSQNASDATGVWNSTTQKFTVTLHQAGSVKRHTQIFNGSTVVHNLYGFIDVVLPIEEGIYFIQNVATKKYIDIESSSATVGAIIEQNTFNDVIVELKWNLSHVSNGYYRIQSIYSNLYMGLNSSNTTIVAQYSALNDYTLWKVIKSTNGNYQLLCKAIESTGKCLSIPLSTSDNGTNLTTAIYVNDSDYKDEWNFFKNGSDTYLLGIMYEGHDHSSVFGSIIPQIKTLGYNDFNCTITENITSNSALAEMEQSKIYVSRSHGNSASDCTYILLNNSGSSWISSNNVYDFTNDRPLVDFSDCDLMLFVACKTAEHPTQSLPQAAVNAGAKCAIGFEGSISCSHANKWVEKFFELYLSGISIAEAATGAVEAITDEDTGYNGETDSFVICYCQ